LVVVWSLPPTLTVNYHKRRVYVGAGQHPKHAGKDFTLHFKAALVEAVGEDFEHVSEEVDVVAAVEDIHNVDGAGEVLECVVEQVKTEIAEGAELVLDRPHHTVHDGVKLVLGHVVQLLEVVLDDGLKEREEVGAMLREGVEVGGDHR